MFTNFEDQLLLNIFIINWWIFVILSLQAFSLIQTNKWQHAYANFEIQFFLNISTVIGQVDIILSLQAFFTEMNTTRGNMHMLNSNLMQGIEWKFTTTRKLSMGKLLIAIYRKETTKNVTNF